MLNEAQAQAKAAKVAAREAKKAEKAFQQEQAKAAAKEAKAAEKAAAREAKKAEKAEKAEKAMKAVKAVKAVTEDPTRALEHDKQVLSSLEKELDDRRRDFIDAALSGYQPGEVEEAAHVKVLIELAKRELCALEMNAVSVVVQ